MSQYQTVARACRMEYDSETDSVYIVFKVIDEKFKKTLRDEWDKDVPLQVIGKDLVKKENKL